MNHSMNANNSIKCSVSSCTHHNSAKSVCSLSSIQVGCCGPCCGSTEDRGASQGGVRCLRSVAWKKNGKTPGWNHFHPGVF